VKPTLSVIVPVYNAAPYLAECVDSILPQLWPGCRLILVDDESDDGSEKMCLDYATQFSDVVNALRISRSGQSVARNRALDIVGTDYIAFCDADDRYVDGSLTAMVDLLEKEKDCDIAVAQFSQKYDDQPIRDLEYSKVSGVDALVRTLYQDKYYHNSACAKVYRSNLFSNIRFLEGRYYEDLEIQARLYLQSPFVTISKETVYYYRPNPTSFINTWSDKRPDAIFAAKSILDYVAHRSPECVPAAKSRLFSAAFNIFNLATRHRLDKQVCECWMIIKSLRSQMIKDPKVRIKNKIAAAMSYLGLKICRLMAILDKKS